MSSVAAGGPPHTRASSINGGGPVTSTNGIKANNLDGMKGANRVFPHLDDLTAAKPEIDINLPIRSLLQEGDNLAKSAESSLDFRRPDVALKAYIKAYIIAVDLIPRHKDYPALQADRGELHRLYIGFTKRLTSQDKAFTDVKKMIKENNARSGVKPASQISSAVTRTGDPHTTTANGHTRSVSLQPLDNRSMENEAPPRKKPPIQPKPDALHGKALHTTASNGAPRFETELAERFAKLRSPDGKVQVQDPRIRTRPISIPDSVPKSQPGNYTTSNRSAGPREMPSVPTTIPRSSKPPLDVEIPTMPRAPDAIYSPARGTENPATVNLPSSVPRSSSYRGWEGSAPPISTVGPTPDLVDNREDYFSSAHSLNSNPTPKRTSKPPPPPIPDSPTITAEELRKFLTAYRILLVDIRSREEFDAGHIMSQLIICVEPIALRHGVSGEQLGETMVIAPDLEQSLYDQREDFDLIVFYDQSSKTIKSPSGHGSKLQDFYSAVYDFGYDKRLKNPPKLLEGGLDAWVDVLGSSSLQSSLATGIENLTKSPQNTGRAPMVQDLRKLPINRRRTRTSRLQSKEEEKRWDEVLKEESSIGSPKAKEGGTTPDEIAYSRTTEDFFRRFPDVATIQESMVSSTPFPPTPASPPPRGLHDELVQTMPKPPARPPPALPRQRSSGISERGPVATPAHSIAGFDSITSYRVTPGLTGLQNSGVICYMNSAIQCISATPFLRDLLINYQYPPEIPIPRKGPETTDPPQLMVRSLGNLLGHLWSGQYDYVAPRTFAKYVNTIHSGSQGDVKIRDRAYGGTTRQHDAAEFFDYVIDILDDELNPLRNQPEPKKSDEVQATFNKCSLLEGARRSWQFQMTGQASPITQQFKGQQVQLYICPNCNQEHRGFNSFNSILLSIVDETTPQSFRSAVLKQFGNRTHGEVDGYTCQHCKQSVTATQWNFITYFPNYLVIHLIRYHAHDSGKIKTKFTFPENGLDLTDAFLPPDGGPAPLNLQPGQIGPFRYDIYAVLQHQGNSIASGHYWTLAKHMDKPSNNGRAPGAWHQWNDSFVTASNFAQTQLESTTTLFLRRQGTYPTHL